MKRVFYVIFLAIIGTVSVCAQTITGSVRESSSNDAIPYATVSLLHTDSSLVSGAISDNNGHFQLAASAGQYVLQVSYVGYTTVCKNVRINNSKQEIGDIFLSEETKNIAEVQVKANRPLIQRQMEKLVLNVSEGPFSTGFSGEEILKKAPGVVIDKNGNITVNGKAVTVYIDGRPSYLDGAQLASLLQGTDAAMIDKVEIIMHPSAKYDAAGNGGIIVNIKMKKNKMKGTNGSLSASYGGMYFKKPGKYYQNDRFAFSLNHRAEHTYTAFSVNQWYNTGGSSSIGSSQRPFAADTMRTVSDSRNGYDSQWYNISLSNDWYIDEKNTFGFIMRVPFGLYNNTSPAAYNRSVITLGNDTVQHMMTDGYTHNVSPSCMANVNYTHVFSDSLSRELTVEATYNRSDEKSNTHHTNSVLSNVDSIMSAVPSNFKQITKQTSNRYVVKADFQTSFWRTGMIECGAKWQLNQVGNDMNADSIMPAWSSTTNTNHTYSEHIAALYISAGKRFGEHWNTKIGLRGELTSLHGEFKRGDEEKEVKQKPYFNLFPSVFVGYDPTDKWSLSLSYSRTIWRPGIWYMNPFVEYSTAHDYEVGNMDIKPEFTNGVDFNVGWSRYISLSLSFSHTANSVEWRPQLLENGDKMTMPVNFGTAMRYGGSLSFTEIPVVPKFKTGEQGKRELDGAWLALTANVSLNNNVSIADKEVDSNYGRNSSFSVYYYASLSAYLPKDWQLGVNIWGMTPTSSAYSKWNGGFVLSGSVQKKWPEHGLTLSLNVRDILRTQVYSGGSVGMQDGYSTSYVSTYYGQKVGISLSWNFGQNQRHKYRNVGDTGDEGGKKSSSPGM